MTFAQSLHRLLVGYLTRTTPPYLRTFLKWTTGLSTHHLASAVYYLGLSVLTAAASILERISTRLYECEAAALAVAPCGVFSTKESAIIILGEADGLARAAALYFSELGYTVFVLSTAGSEPSSPVLSEKASAVSSLLYAWHKRKERSPRASWGMVAPITLDMHSETQRAHASETVHAYCLNSALHLVALIVLPYSSPVSRASRLRRRYTQPVKPGLAFPMWNSSELASSTLEPIVIVGDYFNLLMKSSGRVVVMSRCLPTNRIGVDGLLDGTRECLVQNLSYWVRSTGVRLCSLNTGSREDFGTWYCSRGETLPEDEVDPAGKGDPRSGSPDMEGAEDGVFREIDSARYSADICNILEKIAMSKYPKHSYVIGFRPWLHWLWRVMPDAVRAFTSP